LKQTRGLRGENTGFVVEHTLCGSRAPAIFELVEEKNCTGFEGANQERNLDHDTLMRVLIPAVRLRGK
jgi:hypothetical protein